MSRDYLNAIVRCYTQGQHKFKKYHRIKNVEAKLQKFEQWALTNLPGAELVNYYWSHNGHFAFRRYLTPQEGQP